MSYAYLDCRDRGHAWFSADDPRVRAWEGLAAPSPWLLHRGVGRERVLFCPRCLTERHELFDRFGRRLKTPRYRYPPDYLNPGHGRGREEYRQLAVRAALRALRGGNR